jgi:competence protein ComEC
MIIAMDWWLMTFFLGAILSLFLPEVPAIFLLLLLIFTAFIFFSHKYLRNGSGLLFGAAWMLLHAYIYQNEIPLPILDLITAKKTILVKGEVISLHAKSTVQPEGELTSLQKKSQQITERFNFKVYQMNDHQLARPIIVRLSWKKAKPVIAQGNILALRVKLKPAHGLANIGSFNYLTWLKSKHIVATGYVVNQRIKKNNTEAKKQASNLVKHNKPVHINISIRQQLFNQYKRLMPLHQLAPILLALAFGERSSLKPEHWHVLQATGTSHLIAISGLHVGLLAGAVFMLVMFIMRYLPFSNADWQAYNVIYLAIFASLAFALAYAYLAGFSLPTQRALLMLMIFWCTRLLAIKFSNPRMVLVTVFIVILISPFSLLTISFWLSFYAVIIIFLSLWRFSAWLNSGGIIVRFIKALTIIQLSLTLMLLPITAIAFKQISTVSLAANIIAVPWMSMVTIPTALLSVLFTSVNESIAQWLMFFSLESLSWLWQYLLWLSDLSYASISLTKNQQWLGIIAGSVIFLLIYFPVKTLSEQLIKCFNWTISISVTLLCLLPIYGLNKPTINSSDEQINLPVDNRWQIVFFDVGQGLSVLIKRHERVVLYDTGAYYDSGFNMSEAVILPYLQYLGIDKIDKVIISHSDNDHAGGLEVLTNNIDIDEIISNDSTITARPVTPCVQGKTFIWQGLIFEMLSPTIQAVNTHHNVNDTVSKNVSSNANNNTKSKSTPLKRSKNDNSCVIKVSDTHETSLLLSGDISSKIEQQLLIQFPKLSANILQVPHHGSKTSSSEAFLKQLSPEIAVVSAGYLNRWRMPTVEVQQRYVDNHIQLLNNAQLGQIILTIDENGVNTRSFVNDFKPFWFSR